MLQSSGLIDFAILSAAWFSVFHIHRAAGVDPHNPAVIGGKFASTLKATFVVTAALATGALNEGEQAAGIAGFLGMFALANTVSVPFVSGSALTAEEEPGAFQRWLFGLRQSIGGGLILKLVVVFLAFLFPDSYGLYVVVPVIALGTIMVEGKLFQAVVMREARGDETHRQETRSAPSEPVEIPNVIKMAIAYMFGCGLVLAILQQNEVVIDPANWMGWTGFLVGAAFGRSS